MKDLLGKEIRLNDEVVYVYTNKQSKIQTKQGKVIGFNNFGVRVQTPTSIITVKNVIIQNKGLLNSLFSFIKA